MAISTWGVLRSSARDVLIREDLTGESRLGARSGKADTFSWGRVRQQG